MDLYNKINARDSEITQLRQLIKINGLSEKRSEAMAGRVSEAHSQLTTSDRRNSLNNNYHEQTTWQPPAQQRSSSTISRLEHQTVPSEQSTARSVRKQGRLQNRTHREAPVLKMRPGGQNVHSLRVSQVETLKYQMQLDLKNLKLLVDHSATLR